MRQTLKISFFLLFSPLVLAQGLSYKGLFQRSLQQSFYRHSEAFPLKDIGFFQKDSPYYISALSPHISLIVSEEFTDFLAPFFKYSQKIDYQLSGAFELTPYFRKNYLVFSSPRHQVSNALATVYPFPFVQIYSSGSVDFMDRWSLFSWPKDTLLHEMTHIYQLSQNTKWDRVLWPFFSFFSYRNVVLPSWILEGSAVLVESIYGSGGRLFSGFARAFVFSQIKEGFSLKRLLKPYDDSFSSLEKYLHGAYFFSYLHSQYGLRGTKKLFHESGRFFPLDYYGLNSSLKRAFGKDLLTLFEGYKAYYKDLAQEQKSSPEPVLLKSKVYVPINSDQNSIYFLISDMKSPAQLIVFDKKTEAVEKTEKNLSIGKVFYRDGEYYSAASLRTSSSSIEYSLVKENFQPVRKYNSQNVMDFYENKPIAIDARQSHTGNSLIIDKVFYDTVDSSVVADSKGAVYYFKQNGEYRTLYKNKTALFQFKSYFSYPVEVNEKGLYFIGAGSHGSSLFVYKEDSGVYRLSESDTIVSARQIKGNRFLVSEVTPTHYEYKVIETKEQAEEPVLYKYSFQKENIFLSVKDKNRKAIEPKPLNQQEALRDTSLARRGLLEKDFLQKNFKAYRAFSHLSLQQAFFFYMPLYIPELSLFFQFLDPLQFNQLLVFNRMSKENKFFDLAYSYQKYRPLFGLSFFYDESQLNVKEDKYLIQTFKDIGFLDTEDIFYPVKQLLVKRNFLFQRTWRLNLSVSYPFYINSESLFNFQSQFGVGEMEFNKNKIWKNYISQSGQLEYQFKRKYPQAYSYHKKREIKLMYDFLHLKESFQEIKGAFQVNLTEELKREYFLSFHGKILLSLWDRELKRPQIKEETVFYCSDLKQAIQEMYQKKNPCPNKLKQSLHNLYQGNIELLKVLDFSYYPLTAPFSLRRLAPLTGLSFLSAQDFNSDYRSFFIPFIGLEGELSLLHEKLIVRMGLSVENWIELFKPYKNSEFQLSVWLKSRL